jgi:flavin reductase (DIM6/NTAB) family NADH-FMN oxidoreductase RutF
VAEIAHPQEASKRRLAMAEVTAPAAILRDVSAAELRRACGRFATGVTVVTVRDGEGAHGMTANSFASVSLDPPLVLVSIERRRHTHKLLEQRLRFAVSVLARTHRGVSDRFASRHGEVQGRFHDVPHRLTDDGLPIIEGALASFVCRVVAVHPAGDHSLFVGRVEQLAYDLGAAALVFFDGGYRELRGADANPHGRG